jgi:hypothetical protein
MPGLSKFMGVSQRRDAFNDAGVFTQVTPNSSVTFDTTTTPGTVYITLAVGDYFYRVVGLSQISAIATKYDMLEIEHTDTNGNTSRRTYIVSSLVPGTPGKCALLAVDGELPDVANGVVGTLRRWLTMEFFVGDGVDEYRQSLGFSSGRLPRGFIVAAPPALTATPTNPVPTAPAQFYGPDLGSSTEALEWGGFNASVTSGSTYQGKSGLMANGDILSFVGGVKMAFAEFINDVTSDNGNIVAQVGNVLATTGPSGFNGIVAGKQLAQKTQTFIGATSSHIFDAWDGLTMYFGTSYPGAFGFSAVQFNHVSTNTLLDSEIRFVLYRSNPATTLTVWIPLMYSDAGVTPIPTYIDTFDLFLTPIFGPGGAVDVFVGRQVGNGVYWEAVGHYPVPLGGEHGSPKPTQEVHPSAARKYLRRRRHGLPDCWAEPASSWRLCCFFLRGAGHQLWWPAY